MLIETELGDGAWETVPRDASRAEALGFDGLFAAELKRDPMLTLTVAAGASQRVRLATSVLVAFPRSPMVVAYQARNLQDLCGGRFVLGLGTQVKGHIERRFSTVWDSPGPRLRDYILALRAIWESWQQGTPLRFEGTHYAFSLMTPEFSPLPSAFPAPKIQIAAVNAYNIRLAGELCDGLRVHPLSTPEYTRDVIWPNLRAGAANAGRALDQAGFEVNGTGFIATGPTEEAVRRAREDARSRIAFYASTRAYLPILEHHGWQDLNPKLRRLIAQGRWADLSSVVPDDVLDVICIAGTYDTIVARVRARLEGLVDALAIALPAPGHDERFTEVLAGLRDLRGARTSAG